MPQTMDSPKSGGNSRVGNRNEVVRADETGTPLQALNRGCIACGERMFENE